MPNEFAGPYNLSILSVSSVVTWSIAIVAIVLAGSLIALRTYHHTLTSMLVHNADNPRASLRIAMQLCRSWSPVAVFERLTQPGFLETFVASSHLKLFEHVEAHDWCRRGLSIARKDRTIAQLLAYAAKATADAGNANATAAYLSDLRLAESRCPARPVPYIWLSASCYTTLGRLDLAYDAVQSGLLESNQLPEIAALNTLRVLFNLGRFDDVLEIAGAILDEKHVGNGLSASSTPFDKRSAAILARQMRAYRRGAAFSCALLSLKMLDRWKELDAFLDRSDDLGSGPPIVSMSVPGFRALQAAHFSNANELREQVTKLNGIAERYQSDPRVQFAHKSLLEMIWREFGDYESALAALNAPGVRPAAPIFRSAHADSMAICLEALDRVDEAAPFRAEASQLAPLAFWNRTRAHFADVPAPYNAPFVFPAAR